MSNLNDFGTQLCTLIHFYKCFLKLLIGTIHNKWKSTLKSLLWLIKLTMCLKHTQLGAGWYFIKVIKKLKQKRQRGTQKYNIILETVQIVKSMASYSRMHELYLYASRYNSMYTSYFFSFLKIKNNYQYKDLCTLNKRKKNNKYLYHIFFYPQIINE